jgi:hypothetical protein
MFPMVCDPVADTLPTGVLNERGSGKSRWRFGCRLLRDDAHHGDSGYRDKRQNALTISPERTLLLSCSACLASAKREGCPGKDSLFCSP